MHTCTHTYRAINKSFFFLSGQAWAIRKHFLHSRPPQSQPTAYRHHTQTQFLHAASLLTRSGPGLSPPRMLWCSEQVWGFFRAQKEPLLSVPSCALAGIWAHRTSYLQMPVFEIHGRILGADFLFALQSPGIPEAQWDSRLSNILKTGCKFSLF